MLLNDSGYNFDRYWLPWRADAVPAATDPEVQKKRDAETQRRERLPGLLLFRGSDDASATLVIFLVGETPTSGVEQHQFHAARCFIEGIWPSAGENIVGGILGPTYSGSLESLREAVKSMSFSCMTGTCAADMLRVQAVSATITSVDAIKPFMHTNPDNHFRSTVNNDQSAYCYLVGAPATHWKGANVAYLVESETAYSRLEEDGKSSLSECPGIETTITTTILHYPREISLLRNAYQADPVLGGSRASADAQSLRRQLLLPLRDSQIGRDALPQFSVEQTPITQEAVLLQIAETLRRQRFDAAVVTGTNVLDTLFVTRFLREVAPDVRIAVLDSDLLFVHGTDSLDYLGTLFVSSYPLLTKNSFSEKDSGCGSRLFSSNAAEGIYNAAVLLMQPFRQGKCGEPKDFLGDKPGLWLSVVGRGSYWPVTELDPAVGLDLSAFVQGLPLNWNVVFFSCSLLVALYAGTCSYAIFWNHPNGLQRWFSDLHPAPDENQQEGVAACPFPYHLLTSVFILAAYSTLSLAPVYLAFFKGAEFKWPFLEWVALTLIAGLLIVSIRTAKFNGVQGWLVLGGTLLFLAGGMFGQALLDAPSRLFYAYRSVNLPSGVSPNLPLIMLMMALAWWAWTNWQRSVFRVERNPGVPDLQVKSSSGGDTKGLPASLTDEIQTLLSQDIFAGGWQGVIPVSVLVAATLSARIWLQSFESRWYDWWFVALLTAVGATLIATAYGYFQVWRGLRRFLETLSRHPLRRTFQELPPVSTWSPLWQPSARTRSYSLPKRALETVRLLELNSSGGYYCGLKQDTLDLQKAAGKILDDRVPMGLRETASEVADANAKANRIAERLGERLESEYWNEGFSLTLAAQDAKIEEKSPTKWGATEELNRLAAEFVALRYIAYIRYVMLQLQNQLSFMTVAFILAAIAVNAYPFQGGNYLRWWITGVFAFLAATVVRVFLAMERDTTLSYLTNTKPGEVEKGLALKLVSAGILPLMAVLASQFPDVGRFLFSWVMPALSTLH